jgi:hypothetical protein
LLLVERQTGTKCLHAGKGQKGGEREFSQETLEFAKETRNHPVSGTSQPEPALRWHYKCTMAAKDFKTEPSGVPMLRFITFAFILTHSVMAQAAGISGNVRIETQKWVATHSGETEIDGLPVIVRLEEARHDLGIREAMVGAEGLVPLVAPQKRAYRLTFTVAHNPRIQATYVVQPRNVSIEGAIRFAYVSELYTNRDFQFVITAQEDGSLAADFTRKLAAGGVSTGRIKLASIPHIL